MLLQYSVEFFRLAGSEMTILLLSEELLFLEEAFCGENFMMLSKYSNNEDRKVLHKYPLLLTTGIC